MSSTVLGTQLLSLELPQASAKYTPIALPKRGYKISSSSIAARESLRSCRTIVVHRRIVNDRCRYDEGGRSFGHAEAVAHRTPQITALIKTPA